MQSLDVYEERALKSPLHALWNKEEIYQNQRSRLISSMHGDKNTKFFHQTNLARRRRKKIIRIKGSQGECIEEEREIIMELQSFYSNLFSSGKPSGKARGGFDGTLRCIHNQISEDKNDQFVRRASEEEICNAVFQMRASRAPEPDYFSGTFVRKNWCVVSPNIVISINAFLTTGNMPSFLN